MTYPNAVASRPLSAHHEPCITFYLYRAASLSGTNRNHKRSLSVRKEAVRAPPVRAVGNPAATYTASTPVLLPTYLWVGKLSGFS